MCLILSDCHDKPVGTVHAISTSQMRKLQLREGK